MENFLEHLFFEIVVGKLLIDIFIDHIIYTLLFGTQTDSFSKMLIQRIRNSNGNVRRRIVNTENETPVIAENQPYTRQEIDQKFERLTHQIDTLTKLVQSQINKK